MSKLQKEFPELSLDLMDNFGELKFQAQQDNPRMKERWEQLKLDFRVESYWYLGIHGGRPSKKRTKAESEHIYKVLDEIRSDSLGPVIEDYFKSEVHSQEERSEETSCSISAPARGTSSNHGRRSLSPCSMLCNQNMDIDQEGDNRPPLKRSCSWKPRKSQYSKGNYDHSSYYDQTDKHYRSNTWKSYDSQGWWQY